MNILISTLCFINRDKPGAEIYATFAKRLIEDVLIKTPCDVLVTTNEIDLFKEYENNTRVQIRSELLLNHKLTVSVFNQLLKFFTIKDIDSKYDWVLYLDCDAGITGPWDIEELNNTISQWEAEGYDMIGTRTNAILRNELADYENILTQHKEELKINPGTYFTDHLFGRKFRFYNVTTENGPVEWFDAKLPSEHVLLIKNNYKLPVMCKLFEEFCVKYESQDPVITTDMEAFEIGVSAKLAGYNMGDFGNYGLYHIIKIVCNFNNWEKVKY